MDEEGGWMKGKGILLITDVYNREWMEIESVHYSTFLSLQTFLQRTLNLG